MIRLGMRSKVVCDRFTRRPKNNNAPECNGQAAAVRDSRATPVLNAELGAVCDVGA